MSFFEKLSDYVKTLTAGGSLAGVDFIMWYLLLVIATTIIAIAAYFLTVSYIRKPLRHEISAIPPRRSSLWRSHYSIPKYVFGQPERWMAFRTRNIGTVRNALGLTNTEVCSWQQGLSKATERHLFITPPIRGWVLVFGHYLPNPSEDIDTFYKYMRNLSKEVGEVQFFSLDARVHEHGWVRLIDGNVVRSYVWAESVLWNEGRPSSAECSLRMHAFDYGDQLETESLTELNRKLEHNVEHIHALAARWSLDPLRVEPKDFTSEFGLTGEIDQLHVG
ncbi:hypothetical protein N8663_00175 [Verrucomicrobia bacterium]|nr:hypothetical protein [Verrucomicrobiota bacterium]